jgi:hypothetical protein
MQHETSDRLVSRAALDRALEELRALADEAIQCRAKTAAGTHVATTVDFAVGRYGGLHTAIARIRALPDL